MPGISDARARWLLRGCVLLGLLVAAPALRVGFVADDYLQIAQIERWSPNKSGQLNLFTFVPRDPSVTQALIRQGALAYWTAPDLKIAFFRPLSSALMVLDYRLFGRSPAPYHVHTLLWYAALLLAAAALFRGVLPPALALLTLLIFCLDDGHAMAAGWVAARNASVSTVAVLAGLLAHLRWRREGWRPGAWLAPACAAVGLLAGEAGLAGLAYVVAWELIEARPRRWRALAPTAALVAVYLAIHALSGSGARSSGSYLDPLGEPLTFLAQLPARLLLLTGNLIWAAPIDLALFSPDLERPLMAVGAAALLMLASWLPGALRRMAPDEARAVRWLGLGALGAMVVSASALLGERVLLPSSVGGAAVLAALLRDGWRLFRQRARTTAAPLVAGVLALLLAIVNLPLSAAGMLVKVAALEQISIGASRIAREAEVGGVGPTRVVVLHMEDLQAFYLPVVRAIDRGISPQALREAVAGRDAGTLDPSMADDMGIAGWSVLSVAPRAHRLTRTGRDSLELRLLPGGTFLDGMWARTLRNPGLPMRRGHQIETDAFVATVLADDGGRPTRIGFKFRRDLDHPSLCFLGWRDGAFRRFAFPPVGVEVQLTRGPPAFQVIPQRGAERP